MLIKEDVLDVIQNIINEPIKRDGYASKEILILKAIEDMPDWYDEVVTCNHCFYYHPDQGERTGICNYHQGQCYPDDYCSFGINK